MFHWDFEGVSVPVLQSETFLPILQVLSIFSISLTFGMDAALEVGQGGLKLKLTKQSLLNIPLLIEHRKVKT